MSAIKQNRAELPRIECVVTFLTREEGGRFAPFPSGALSGDVYRPHIVVGEPGQQRAIVIDSRGPEEYIGVAFNAGPTNPKAGMAMTVVLTPIYYPHPMYDRLKSGVTFTVREGALVVAFGSVSKWIG